jgi:hypothetical protein
MSEPEVFHPLRPILRNWVWEHGRVGTRYLDCRTGEVKFDDGKKSRFADEPIFHVPLEEDPGGDAGPVVHEGALARFLRAAHLVFTETATTETYAAVHTHSLHGALPICASS